MFEAHFGLRENPFSTSHDPRFVYPSPEHLEAVAHFRYGVQNREAFVLVTGEVGTGKTTAVRDLVGRLPQQAHVALLQNTALSRRELLEEVCHRFGVPWEPELSKPSLIERLERTLGERLDRGEICLLVIDEAQNLSTELLEEIRLLSNLEWRGGHLVHICLAGQPELEERLAAPELRQLRQRISVKYRLKPLDAVESERYVHHRLRVAGGDGPRIFPPDACATLQAITNGIPREINIVAAQALLNAYVAGSPSVRPEHVRQVVDEFGFQSVLAKPKPVARAAAPEPAPQVVPMVPEPRPSAHEGTHAPEPAASVPPAAPAPPPPSSPFESQPLAAVAARPAVAPAPQPAPPPPPRAPAPVPASPVASPSFTPPESLPVGTASRTQRSISNWRDRPPTPLVLAPTREATARKPLPTPEPEEEREPFVSRIPVSVAVLALLVVLGAVFFASGLAGNLWRAVSTAASSPDGSSSVASPEETGEPTGSVPSTRPAPSASSAGSRYGLQVASYRTERRARAVLARLEGETGLKGIVDPYTTAQGEWYRVVLGGFSTPAEANSKGIELSANGAIPADRIVVRLGAAAPGSKDATTSGSASPR